MSRFSIFLVLVCFFSVGPARAATCALKTTLKGYQQADKASARILLRASEPLIIQGRDDNWVHFLRGTEDIFLSTALAEKWCKLDGAWPAVKETRLEKDEMPKSAAGAGETSEGFANTQKVKIAVMDIAAGDTIEASTARVLVNAMTEDLEAMGAFKAVSTQDVISMINYQVQQQALGCTDIDCAADLGNVLGADYIINTDVSNDGGKMSFQLRLVNIKSKEVEKRLSKVSTADTASMKDALLIATQALVQTLLARRSGALRLWVSEEGATVKIDNRIVGVSPVQSLSVAGGYRTLEIEKEGFVVYQRDIQVLQGVEVGHSASLIPSLEYRSIFEERAQRKRTAAWASFGIGGASLAAAGILAIVNHNLGTTLNEDVDLYNREPERSSSRFLALEERQNTLAALDIVMLSASVVGVVGLSLGTYFYFSGDDPKRYQKQVDVGFAASAESWSLMVSGGF